MFKINHECGQSRSPSSFTHGLEIRLPLSRVMESGENEQMRGGRGKVLHQVRCGRMTHLLLSCLLKTENAAFGYFR